MTATKKPIRKQIWGAHMALARRRPLPTTPPAKRKRIKPITASMYMVMELVADDKNVFTGCTHERTYGARSISVDATRARGLIDESHKSQCGYVLTYKGKAARNRPLGLKVLASMKKNKRK